MQSITQIIENINNFWKFLGYLITSGFLSIILTFLFWALICFISNFTRYIELNPKKNWLLTLSLLIFLVISWYLLYKQLSYDPLENIRNQLQ